MSDSNDALVLLEQLIPKLPLARQAKDFGTTVDDAGTEALTLASGVNRLEQWQLSADLFRGFWTGEECEASLQTLQQLQEQGRLMALAQDREQLARIPAIVAELKPRIANLLRDGGRVWQRRIGRDIGSLGSLASLLTEFPDTRAVGLRIDEMVTLANSLKIEFPPSANQRTIHARVLEQVAQLKRDLAEIGASESVQRFLLALADETATLDMLDDAIRNWLRERRAENRLRLSLARVGGR